MNEFETCKKVAGTYLKTISQHVLRKAEWTTKYLNSDRYFPGRNSNTECPDMKKNVSYYTHARMCNYWVVGPFNAMNETPYS